MHLQQMRERSLEGTRARAAALYHSKWCQRSVLTMIALSFASDVLQAELLPEQHSPDGALGRNDDTGFRVTPKLIGMHGIVCQGVDAGRGQHFHGFPLFFFGFNPFPAQICTGRVKC